MRNTFMHSLQKKKTNLTFTWYQSTLNRAKKHLDIVFMQGVLNRIPEHILYGIPGNLILDPWAFYLGSLSTFTWDPWAFHFWIFEHFIWDSWTLYLVSLSTLFGIPEHFILGSLSTYYRIRELLIKDLWEFHMTFLLTLSGNPDHFFLLNFIFSNIKSMLNNKIYLKKLAKNPFKEFWFSCYEN